MTFSNPRLLSVALLFSTIAVPGFAAEGIQITQRVTVGTTAQTTQTQIEKTRMRSEVTGATGTQQVVVYDTGKGVIDLIDTGAKTYTEMTKAELEAMAAMAQNALTMMQAQMANMSPAQRAQMEAMMRGRGLPTTPAAKPEFRKGGTSKVGRWTCNVYEGYENGQKTSDVCTVSASALGVTEADFAVAGQLASLLSKLMPQIASAVLAFGSADSQGFDGFPVRVTATLAGVQTTMEVTDVARQTFPDSMFTVPAGFQKQDILSGMAAMGGAARGAPGPGR
ncbi:MAG: DUF4412 domain-containing protein [Vicinamibacterales bacterium]